MRLGQVAHVLGVSSLLTLLTMVACSSAPDDGPDIGATPMRRLTRVEYANSVADIFGIPPPSVTNLPEDAKSHGFTTTTGQLTTASIVLKYFNVALQVSDTVAPRIGDLFACGKQDETSCVRAFLGGTATRIFRRPLKPDEVANYEAVFSTARSGGASFDKSAARMVEALLVAPQFLFVIEATGATPGKSRRLDSWQVATRLSLMLWQTAPDDALLTAAKRDELTSVDGVRTQVQRMLADARARPAIRSFFSGWLGLADIERVTKDKTRFPDLTSARMAELAAESFAFVEDVFWEQKGDASKLLVSPTYFRSSSLASFYGDGSSTSTELTRVSAPETEKRFGLFSQAGFLLAIEGNEPARIIYRGKFVRTHLLCQPLPRPPPNIEPLPKIVEGTTSRARVEAHTAAASCQGCHRFMNPIGFTLEHFDASGRWQDTEGGLAIDDQAEVINAGFDAPVTGALDLSRKLAASPVFHQCVVSNLFEFILHRQPAAEDKALVEVFGQRFAESGNSISELLVEIALSDGFLYRAEPRS